MRRQLFIFCSAVSLLLCAASAVMWIRSYGGSDYVSRYAPDAATDRASVATNTTQSLRVQWTLGQIRLVREQHTYYPPPNFPVPDGPRRAMWSRGRLGVGHMGWEQYDDGPHFWNRWGFCQYQTGWESSFAGSNEEGVTAPVWSLTLLFALLPLVWCIAALRARRRFAAGLCSVCGYDLRATPERCPECGTARA